MGNLTVQILQMEKSVCVSNVLALSSDTINQLEDIKIKIVTFISTKVNVFFVSQKQRIKNIK